MVNGASPRPRGGFTLVEVLLAMVVFGAGVVAIAAGTAVASRFLREAGARDRAVAAAAAVLDSIVAAPVVVSGEQNRAGVRLTWDVFDVGGSALVRLEATTDGGLTGRHMVFETRWVPPPPMLEPAP